jgi:DNA ligase-associated metallophosphoesterase
VSFARAIAVEPSDEEVRVRGAFDADLTVCDVTLHADCGGVLYWPEERMLIVADLHFEKGSSFAARKRMLLPPYDTMATLAALSQVIARYAPRTVVALGDSFHDGDGPARLADPDRATLSDLQHGRQWIWIAGNHDPDPSGEVGGMCAQMLSVGPLTFRHIPEGGDGEIAGHLHPSARISVRGRSIARRCFAADGSRIVMPAFGAYTGGLSIRDRAFAAVFGTLDFTAHMLGQRRIFAFAAEHCL